MTGRRRKRRQDPHRTGHGVRWQPQTGLVGRCQTCGHLFDKDKDDDSRECLSCRETPPLFQMGEAVI